MADKKPNTKRTLIIAVAVFVAIAIIFSVYWVVIESPKTATIDIVVAPVSADVKVGNVRFNNGKHRIEPGTYDVGITKEGFGG